MKKCLAMISLLTLSTATTYATTLSTQDNLSDNLLLNSTTISGYFDLSPQLQGDQFNTPYSVNSGSATFNFTDNSDIGTETAIVTLASGSKSWTSPNVVWGYNTYWYQSGSYWVCTSTDTWGDCNGGYYQPVYSSYQAPYYGNTGSGSLTFLYDLNTNPQLVTDLSTDGKLSFSVSSQGSLVMTNSVLSADISPNPVPEPSTIALLGLGGLALGLYNRKRRSRK